MTATALPGRELSLVSNSLALIAAKVAAMGLGFVFWLAAARLFGRAEVGVAAAVVSAMMLCSQLALVGIGSSVVSELPAHRREPWPLLASATRVVLVASCLTGVGFLVLDAVALEGVDVAGRSLVFAILFVAATVFGTFGALLDQTATALRRGDQNLVRGILFGGATVVVLLVAVGVGLDRTAPTIFAPWVAAGALACAVGVVQLRRALPARPPGAARADRELTGRLLRLGAPNHALTLAERLPGLILPIVVTEVLSPQANAAWYLAWMMAWVVYIVPIQVGMTVFAEVAADRDALPAAVRRGVRTSLALGGLGIVAAVVLARPVLSLLGSDYADDGTAPLRILVLGVVPMTFTLTYFAACRALRRLREALIVGWAGALVSLGAAAAAGAADGLEAIAVVWLVVQLAMGAWSAGRLARLRRGIDGRGD